MRTKKSVLVYVPLFLMAALSMFPILYTVSNSFMGADEIQLYYGSLGSDASAVSPLHLIPDRITLSGYSKMLLEKPHYLMKFWAAISLCAVIVAGQTVISALGGYAFAKYRFPGRDIIFFFLITLMMMPNQVMLVPSYIVLDAMGLLGSNLALILPSVFSAFGVFLISQFMSAIPDSILESARIDGAGHFRILTNILLPNCKAGLASLAVLGFIDCWNMVEQPLVFLKDFYKYPFSLFLLQINTLEPALGFSCGVLSMIPVLLLFLFFEDELISGISYSVLK